jgi:alkylation response protein AidB-like acyl-CoA dehydrogenase
MQLRFDDETEAFRAELRAWLDEHAPNPGPDDPRPRSSADLPEWARVWQRQLFDAGYLVPAWPSEYGGRNASPVQTMVYMEEMGRRELPRSFNPQGLSIITPSIIDYGTEEQKRRFAVPTLKAEITWSLGMSEPGAGSDLAALKTRADVHDDHFVVNGQKVWTSGAHHSDWNFCFVRTDPDAPKHKGISVILIDMHSPGITIRPLPDVLGKDHADFNEVFFDDVVVPRDHLIGELNRGWSIAGGSLAHERGMMWIMAALSLDRDVDRMVSLVGGSDGAPGGGRLADDLRHREKAASYYIDAQAMMLMGYKGFAKFARGMQSPEHSVLKLFGSEAQMRLRADVAEMIGASSIETDEGVDLRLHGGGTPAPWQTLWFYAFSQTIAAGTSEIQRNIIAERVLGLPR